MGLTKVNHGMSKLPFSNRNKIINGNFDIWQRGDSFTTIGYGPDRWFLTHVGSSKVITKQPFIVGQTEVPGNPQYFMRTVVTSVLGASNNVVTQYRIESVRQLAGKKATLSFYAKADTTRNMSIEFAQNFGTGGTPSEYNTGIGVNKITLTSSWQKFIVTVNIPGISEKTIGTDNNHYLNILFWLDAGANLASRTANLGQQSGTFDIAQVQLEEGEIATPFEERHIADELALCQRYARIIHVYMMNSGFIQDYLFTEMRGIPTATVMPGATFVGGTFAGYRRWAARQTAYSTTAGNGAILLDAEL